VHVAFRVDASLHIGSGHVMRCLALAAGLAAQGSSCTFIMRSHVGSLIDLVESRGFPVRRLAPGQDEEPNGIPNQGQSSHLPWLGVGWELDAAQVANALNALAPVDWLVVDHYALDERWEINIRPSVGKLLIIDDLADRPHACDVLMDQNPGRLEFDYLNLVPGNCRLLIDPMFALLRPEFGILRDRLSRESQTKTGCRIHISMGGVDRVDATSRVLEGLSQCVLPAATRVTVVMGRQSPWVDRARAIASAFSCEVEVLVDVENMAGIMAASDLAIGAGGITALERCCLGLPSLVVVVANNQRPGARALFGLGAALLIEDGPKLKEEVREQFERLLEGDVAARMAGAARKITEGKGVELVVAEMRGG
jgi:UDP-2,4-diacetamido-2,4,6-trideoxy-beta-L-altropyranose hydrolase